MICYTCSKNVVKPNIINFPDGTFKIDLFNNTNSACYMDVKDAFKDADKIQIYWQYDNESELPQLIYITQGLRNISPMTKISLFMPYIPNARMDRTHSDNEVFTLKYFCDLINYLNYHEVYVLDAHSSVSTALINNCRNVSPKQLIEFVKNDINFDNKSDCVFFPDEGSCKRYSPMLTDCENICFGIKHRDWSSGKIENLEIHGVDVNDKNVLIIDDICSYGGTAYYSALELKKHGCKNINIFFTHTEDSINKGKLIDLLNNNTIEHIYTTNSLYSKGSSARITAIDIFDFMLLS
jgi:ribose-phosphate pyrophosphokinase